MMNHSNTFGQKMGSQDLRFLKDSATNQSSNPVTAFLRAGAPATWDNAASQMNAMNNLNLNDLKRLQQLQLQLQNQHTTPSNPMHHVPPSAHPQQDPSVEAMLQSYLDQKMRASKFDYSLRTSLGMAGMSGQHPMLGSTILQERLMMNQSGMNGVIQVPSQTGELPLPSPRSLSVRDKTQRMRGGVIEPFPEKLHRVLLEVEAAGRSDVISFVANGQAFAIHKPDKFFKEIIPLYFRHSRLSSFKRQLNLYGFELINTPGPARGGYWHELFVKDRPALCRRMRRVAVKASPTKKDALGSPSKNSSEDALEKGNTIPKQVSVQCL